MKCCFYLIFPLLLLIGCYQPPDDDGIMQRRLAETESQLERSQKQVRFWQVVTVAVAAGGLLLLVGFAAGGIGYCRYLLGVKRRPTAVLAAQRIARAARGLLLVHFAVIVLVFGWLNTIPCPLANRAVRTILSVPLSRSTSAHRNASSSPDRAPVCNAR